jgi:hypothetical protein
MTNTTWYVRKTPCWPAQWKVTFDWRGQDYGSNDTSNFFRDEKAAQEEANKRNAREIDE